MDREQTQLERTTQEVNQQFNLHKDSLVVYGKHLIINDCIYRYPKYIKAYMATKDMAILEVVSLKTSNTHYYKIINDGEYDHLTPIKQFS